MHIIDQQRLGQRVILHDRHVDNFRRQKRQRQNCVFHRHRRYSHRRRRECEGSQSHFLIRACCEASDSDGTLDRSGSCALVRVQSATEIEVFELEVDVRLNRCQGWRSVRGLLLDVGHDAFIPVSEMPTFRIGEQIMVQGLGSSYDSVAIGKRPHRRWLR